VKGRIKRSLRLFHKNVMIDGYVSPIGGWIGAGYQFQSGIGVEKRCYSLLFHADLAGAVRGNANIHCERVVISGVITGDVTIEAREIEIVAPAVITGNLTYISNRRPTLQPTRESQLPVRRR